MSAKAYSTAGHSDGRIAGRRQPGYGRPRKELGNSARARHLGIVLAWGSAAVVSAQQGSSAAADEVLAMVKAQWSAEMADPKNVAAQMKYVADDYTEFNGEFATRLDGKAMNVRLGEATGSGSGRTVASEMANPKVQVYNGDVAIVTYNDAGLTKDKDGKVEPNRAKSTGVYVKQGGKWMLVHANFAPDPLPH